MWLPSSIFITLLRYNRENQSTYRKKFPKMAGEGQILVRAISSIRSQKKALIVSGLLCFGTLFAMKILHDGLNLYYL